METLLELVSVLLAAISLLLAIGGFAAFFEIRNAAKRKAKQVAKEETILFLQEHLPNTVKTVLRDLLPQINALVNTNELSDDYSNAQEMPSTKGKKK